MGKYGLKQMNVDKSFWFWLISCCSFFLFIYLHHQHLLLMSRDDVELKKKKF